MHGTATWAMAYHINNKLYWFPSHFKYMHLIKELRLPRSKSVQVFGIKKSFTFLVYMTVGDS